MAQETVNSIKAAELKAAQIVKDAENQRDAILQAARDEVKVYQEKLINQAKSRAEAAVGQVYAEKDAQVGIAESQAEAVVAQHRAGKEANKAEAVRMVISEIA